MMVVMIVFVEWLTDGREFASFPADIIIENSLHNKYLHVVSTIWL